MIEKLKQYATDEKQGAGPAESPEAKNAQNETAQQIENILNLGKMKAHEVIETLINSKDNLQKKILKAFQIFARSLSDFGYQDVECKIKTTDKIGATIKQLLEEVQKTLGLKVLTVGRFEKSGNITKRHLIVNPANADPRVSTKKETNKLIGKTTLERVKGHLQNFPPHTQELALLLGFAGRYGNWICYEQMEEQTGKATNSLRENLKTLKPIFDKLGLELKRELVDKVGYWSLKMKEHKDSPILMKNLKDLKSSAATKRRLKAKRDKVKIKHTSSKTLLTRSQDWREDYDPVFDEFYLRGGVLPEVTIGPQEKVREYDYDKLKNPNKSKGTDD